MRAGDDVAAGDAGVERVSIRAGSHESRRHQAKARAALLATVSIRAGSHESRRRGGQGGGSSTGEFQSAPAPMRAGDGLSTSANPNLAGFNPRRLP